MTANPGLSDLSVTEFAALARLGFVPKGLVVGTCFYDARWQSTVTTITQELSGLSQALRRARHHAVAQLVQQAADLGAEGVVGVRVEMEHHKWRGDHHVAHFQAIGTAIGRDSALTPPEFLTAPSLRLGTEPFTSDLSGQDFVSLLRAGYRPIALASGNCVYQLGRASTTFTESAEITEYSEAYAEARETAMGHLYNDLMAVFPKGNPHQPCGVVGMRVEESSHAGQSNVVEFRALGTAVALLAADDPRRRTTPLPVQVAVSLDQ